MGIVTEGFQQGLWKMNDNGRIGPNVFQTMTQSILSVSRLRGNPNVCRQYKEAQIHGPIDLEKDVQTLSVPGSAATYEFRHVVAKLQQKTKCAILWQHDLLNGT